MIKVGPGKFAYMGKFVMKEDHATEKFDNLQKMSHAKLRQFIERAIPNGYKSYSRGRLKKYSLPIEKFITKTKVDFQNTGWVDFLNIK